MTVSFSGKQLSFLTFGTRLSTKNFAFEWQFKNQGQFWKKGSKFGACSGFFEVKNRLWSVAHTDMPDIRESTPPPGGIY